MKRSLAALILAASSQLAVAESVDTSLGKQEFADGKAAYASGDYLKAALHFSNAYKADPDPAYIFNAGQAYRRRAEAKSGDVPHDCQQSLFAYRKFLDQLPEAPNKSEVDGYIKEMTTCAGKLASEPSPWDPPVDKPPVDKPPIDKPPPPDKPVEPPIETPVGGSGGLTTKQYAGIGVGAAGLVATGVGLFFAKKSDDTNTKKDRLVAMVGGDPTDAERAELRGLNDEGSSQENKAWAFGIAGGVAVIGGVVLFLTGGASAKEQKLTVETSSQGAMVLGTFRF